MHQFGEHTIWQFVIVKWKKKKRGDSGVQCRSAQQKWWSITEQTQKPTRLLYFDFFLPSYY